MRRCADCKALKPFSDYPRHRRLPTVMVFTASSASLYVEVPATGDAARRKERSYEPTFRCQTMRRCPACTRVKALDEFPRNRSARGGRGGYCKPCHNAKGKATYTRLYGGTRHYHLQRRYGISAERVEELIAEQGGLCAICLTGKPEHVDHDHRTGEVRGILCFNCNGGLGQMRDRVDVLLAPSTTWERSHGGSL